MVGPRRTKRRRRRRRRLWGKGACASQLGGGEAQF